METKKVADEGYYTWLTGACHEGTRIAYRDGCSFMPPRRAPCTVKSSGLVISMCAAFLEGANCPDIKSVGFIAHSLFPVPEVLAVPIAKIELGR